MVTHTWRSLKKALPVAALLTLALAPMGSISAASRVADGNNIVLASPMAQSTEPVTIYNATTEQILTLDPQVAEDSTSIPPVENLFLGLTDLDPKTTEPRAELATKWEANAAGDVWTYTLRDDVPWVRYDPSSGQTTEIRKVTAQDFVYGIQRACDPRIGGLYTKVAAAMIKGCDAVVKTPVSDLTDATFEQVGAKALSDTQLEITLTGPLGYWNSASTLWIFRATPKEAIAEFGDKWIEPGNIITDGPFVLAEWDRTVNRVFLKNPLFPEGVNDNYGGNIERVSTQVVGDGSTIYTLYQNNEIDVSGVPQAELDRIRQDATASKELRQFSDLAVSYIGFMYDKPPFNDVHVRRAFSAAIDRQALVNDVLQNRALPMAHFMPPAIFGSVPINEVGIGQPDTPGFDKDYAVKELAAGGFADCQNFPDITLMDLDSTLGSILQNAMKTVLNCDPNKLTIETVEWNVLLQSVKPDVPTAQRPHMYAMAWGPDYPDAENWMFDVLSCKAQNVNKRPCDDAKIDKMIDDAAKSTDPEQRKELYRQLEEAFFGPEGDFPIAPLAVNINWVLYKPWYTGFFETDGLFGGPHWESRRIDQAAQLAARPQK